MPLEIQIETGKLLSEIEIIKSTGGELLKKEFDSPKKLILETEMWKSKSKKSILENTSNLPERLKEKLDYLSRDSFRHSNRIYGVFYEDEKHHVENLKEELTEKITAIQIVCDYIITSDSLNDKYVLKTNSIQDKISYVLNKLNLLYNDNFYSISMFLELNNIDCRSEEGKEIAENLVKRGYAIGESAFQSNDLVKISLKGAAYIERINKQLAKKTTLKREKSINHKIDSILIRLEKLGYGQEILFNEIEELKDLSKVLSEKTWSQLIKGKVIDLALSKVISKEVASYIYEALVDNPFKLLK